ncbi:MAG: hypothetical protein ABMA13_05200 [Chthoniobacteraceae bacterium]
MAEPTSNFQRLTRNRFGLAGTGALWLGPDHLLLVSNSGGVERYRRWFFKDIQLLVARRTARRLILNLIGGSFGALLALGALASFASAKTDPADSPVFYVGIVLASFAGVCLGLCIANSIFGPGCIVHVLTPMGAEPLAAPRRLNVFNRIAARIGPLIEAAQRKAG